MADNEVAFTSGFATVVVDLHRRMTTRFGEECKLAYLPCCLLASMRAQGGTMRIADFPREAIANVNTIVAAAIKLERCGLIEKTYFEKDRRVAVLRETDAGNRAVERALDGVYRHLRETVWRRFSEANIDEIVRSFEGAADAFGIPESESSYAVHPRLTPAFLEIVAAMVRRWSQTTSLYADLTLTEYRCLALLEDGRSLPCSVIADMLMLDRNTVSAAVKSLREKGYAKTEKGVDRRQRLVSATESGRKGIALSTDALRNQTGAWYADVSPSLQARANEIHARMYVELADWAHDGRVPVA